MPRVSAEHKEAVRRRIMQAALHCLERNDYQDVTTRELLSEVGLSIGTFYNYFPSKEHLYEALAEEALAGDISVALARGGDQPVATVLVDLLRAAMTTPVGSVALAAFRSRMRETPAAAEAVARLNQYMIDQISPLVEKAQVEGSIRADLDPEAMTELFDIIWDGLGRRQGTGTMQTSYGRVGEVVLALFLGNIEARPAGELGGDVERDGDPL